MTNNSDRAKKIEPNDFRTMTLSQALVDRVNLGDSIEESIT